ncbi:GerMN domain-containing protein [Clostridiaceae bacterium M8S5]|nr:GerMN domain-containing protein [Clostridiaceae bacterium M8S5]
MLNSIKNILIIVLIVILATGISIKYSPLTTLDTSDTTSNVTESAFFLESNSANSALTNPRSISILHKSTREKSLSFYDDYMLAGRLYKNNKFYKAIDFVLVSEKPFNIDLSPDKPYSVEINLSKDNLKVPDGKYKLVITTNAIGLKYSCKAIELDINYKSSSPYVKASNKLPSENLNALTLYYSCIDSDVEQLVGITRFKKVSRNVYNFTLKELQTPVDINTGLCPTSPIDTFHYVSQKNGITYIDLPSSNDKYTNPKTARKAMNSFIKTIACIPNHGRVKFLVDYNRADTFFNGVNINKSIECNNFNKSYLAYDSGKRYLLVDCDVPSISKSDDTTSKANQIFNAMKNFEYHGLLNVIPKDVNLQGISVDNNIITLNFNNAISNAHANNNHLRSMMIDAILFSFTSIEGIDYVLIKSNGNALDGFKGYDLSKAVKRPLYINPE